MRGVALLLVGLLGCSAEDRPPPLPDTPNDATVSDVATDSTSAPDASDAEADAPVTCVSTDAGCSSYTSCAPVIPVVKVAQSIVGPYANGGVVTDGTYTLVADEIFTGPNGESGPTIDRSSEILLLTTPVADGGIDGGVSQIMDRVQALQSNNQPLMVSVGTMSFSQQTHYATMWNDCPAIANPFDAAFDAQPNQLLLYESVLNGLERKTYARQ